MIPLFKGFFLSLPNFFWYEEEKKMNPILIDFPEEFYTERLVI